MGVEGLLALARWRPSPRTVKTLKSIKRRIPIVSNIRANFICFHYAYLIGVTIVGSIILYPGNNMSYIDALLFASGTATQSGLNTIDVNLLSTYQQAWLWFGSMVTNPIFINTFIVFIRLHWFEKRFRHIVQEAKALRRTRSRSMSTANRAQGGGDLDLAEAGIRGRDIVVLRDNEGQAQGRFLDGQKRGQGSTTDSRESSTHPDGDNRNPTASQHSAQPGPTAGSEVEMFWPPRPDDEQHISFLERQRRATNALHIPSPREFSRGGMPQTLINTDAVGLARQGTSQSEKVSDSDQVQPPSVPGSVGQHITIDEPTIARPRRGTTFRRASSRRTGHTGEDANEADGLRRVKSRRGTLLSNLTSRTQDKTMEMPYLSWQPTLGRNSAFADLTDEQRNELGGIEYRALKTLAAILIGYYLFFHLLGIISLLPWILTTRWGKFVTDVSQGRPWWAVFTAGSAFNDQGFTLTPNSMISFYDAIFPLLMMTFLIIIGNTGFPCMLRFVIWFITKFVPTGTSLWEELRFLLDHPRRCFTLLFPGRATWWLFAVLILLNGIDLIIFLVLDIHDPDVTRIPGGIRFVDGLFQAAATRTAGMSVVNLSLLHPATQVSYMIMMYISAYPIAISMRQTNVYEESSLGLHSHLDEDQVDDENPSFMGAHLQKQLSFDMWYIFLGLFIIAIVESARLDDPKQPGFSMFAILFEIISAYGTVGLSLGYPGTDTALSAQFKTLSKLVIIGMQLRGRHRGMPYRVDRAIMLPSEALHKKELEDASKRLRRREALANLPPGLPGARTLGRSPIEAAISTGREMHGAVVEDPSSARQRPVASNQSPQLPTHHE
ncbi:low affinity potassium transporter [Myotisia sp. PD_48]|nr:low affinity potassium transporter [Myotisia sp. PD_48]